jgi:hypothetical protein
VTAAGSKLSESLLAFARPLLELLPDGAGPAKMTPPLHIAVLVWNAVALELLGRESPYLEQARAMAEANTSGLQRDFTLALLADLEARKRSESPPDLRLIGKFEFVTGEHGEMRLRVNSHAVKPSAKRTR